MTLPARPATDWGTWCGVLGPSVDCGCEYHRAWVLLHPEHPDVVEHRARIIEWMAQHPGYNPATGRAMAHPDDFLVDEYGIRATEAELRAVGLVV